MRSVTHATYPDGELCDSLPYVRFDDIPLSEAHIMEDPMLGVYIGVSPLEVSTNTLSRWVRAFSTAEEGALQQAPERQSTRAGSVTRIPCPCPIPVALGTLYF